MKSMAATTTCVQIKVTTGASTYKGVTEEKVMAIETALLGVLEAHKLVSRFEHSVLRHETAGHDVVIDITVPTEAISNGQKLSIHARLSNDIDNILFGDQITWDKPVTVALNISHSGKTQAYDLTPNA